MRRERGCGLGGEALAPGRSIGRMAGFTLIELLVVIGIIAVLVGVVVAVGVRVTQGSKGKATRDVITALDAALTAYISAKDGQIPPAFVLDPRGLGSGGGSNQFKDKYLPVADAEVSPEVLIDSVGLFTLQVGAVAEAEKALRAIPTNLRKLYSPTTASSALALPEISTVLDGWGNPIRYVHPSFDGVYFDSPESSSPNRDSFRKLSDMTDLPRTGMSPGVAELMRRGPLGSSRGNSDSGTCPGTRPYFYSAGPDGDPSTTDDNVYSTTPKLPR